MIGSVQISKNRHFLGGRKLGAEGVEARRSSVLKMY